MSCTDGVKRRAVRDLPQRGNVPLASKYPFALAGTGGAARNPSQGLLQRRALRDLALHLAQAGKSRMDMHVMQPGQDGTAIEFNNPRAFTAHEVDLGCRSESDDDAVTDSERLHPPGRPANVAVSEDEIRRRRGSCVPGGFVWGGTWARWELHAAVAGSSTCGACQCRPRASGAGALQSAR